MAPMIVDSRETNSGIPALLRRAGVELEMQELAAGDYRIGQILIERKTAADLAASILDGRLFGQADALATACDQPLIFIEGDIRSIRSQINESALLGAISALFVFFGVSLATRDLAAQAMAQVLAHGYLLTPPLFGYTNIDPDLRVREEQSHFQWPFRA